MNTLSATQLAAQLTSARVPYIGLTFTSPDGLTTYTYDVNDGTDGIVWVCEQENMPYTSKGLIVLNNSARTIPDLRGYWVEPSWGDVTSAGDEGTPNPRLWVKNQTETSQAGGLQVALDMDGMWEVLDEIEWDIAGTAPFHEYAYDTATALDIMQDCFTRAGMTLTCAVDDGIIDTISVYFYVNGGARANNKDTLKTVVYKAIMLTKCYIRMLPNMEAEIVFPQAADDVDETYYTVSTTGYMPAYTYNERKTVLLPNKITVVANEAGDWNVVEVAEDATAQAMYDPDGGGAINQTWVIAKITNATDAAKIASALLTRAKAELMSAYFETPMDARVQMYDKPQAVDVR